MNLSSNMWKGRWRDEYKRSSSESAGRSKFDPEHPVQAHVGKSPRTPRPDSDLPWEKFPNVYLSDRLEGTSHVGSDRRPDRVGRGREHVCDHGGTVSVLSGADLCLHLERVLQLHPVRLPRAADHKERAPRGHAHFFLYSRASDLSDVPVRRPGTDHRLRMQDHRHQVPDGRLYHEMVPAGHLDHHLPDHLCLGHHFSVYLLCRTQYDHGNDGHALYADLPAGLFRRRLYTVRSRCLDDQPHHQ